MMDNVLSEKWYNCKSTRKNLSTASAISKADRLIIRMCVWIKDAQTNALDWYWLIALGCTQQSRAPNIDRCAINLTLSFDLDPWPWPLTLQGNSEVKTRLLSFDLDLWPPALTYNPNLAKVKVDIHTKYQGRRSNGLRSRAQTDGQTDGRHQTHYSNSNSTPYSKLEGNCLSLRSASQAPKIDCHAQHLELDHDLWPWF